MKETVEEKREAAIRAELKAPRAGAEALENQKRRS